MFRIGKHDSPGSADDRQAMIPPDLTDHVNANLDRQFEHGEKIFEFYENCRLKYPLSLHFLGQRAADSLFYVKRIEGNG